MRPESRTSLLPFFRLPFTSSHDLCKRGTNGFPEFPLADVDVLTRFTDRAEKSVRVVGQQEFDLIFCRT